MAYNSDAAKSGGVFNIWLDATLNFQRLDFSGLPLEITITFKTPMFQRVGQSRGLPQRQLERLREAAFDTHMAFLEDWFPATTDGKPTNDAVSYQADEGLQIERLTLHLNKLAGRTLIQRDMSIFREYLERWKYYLDDREFPGDYAVPVPE